MGQGQAAWCRESCCQHGDEDRTHEVQCMQPRPGAEGGITRPAAFHSRRVAVSGDRGGSQPSFRATLIKRSDGMLGLDVEDSPYAEAMRIAGVRGGAAQEWNSANPKQELRPGDEVVEVNGVRGTAGELLDRCRSDAVVEMVILRAAGAARPAGSAKGFPVAAAGGEHPEDMCIGVGCGSC
mmetsp:Transcript_67681/g.195984  ORF Transcript_67681/g.195984 Transcript_67681/m.195984 type:complete len:181 (+) Transcript_67681:68-610(+)